MDASAMLLLGILGGAPNLPDYHLLQQHLTHNIVLQVWGVGGRGEGREGRSWVLQEWKGRNDPGGHRHGSVVLSVPQPRAWLFGWLVERAFSQHTKSHAHGWAG